MCGYSFVLLVITLPDITQHLQPGPLAHLGHLMPSTSSNVTIVLTVPLPLPAL